MTPVAEAFQAAIHYQQTGNLRQAEQHYRLCVQADPDHADAWLRLAEICHKLGRPDEAVAGYRHVQRLRPDSADACHNIGAVTT
jgi:Tfp pilus assembly protein PilF